MTGFSFIGLVSLIDPPRKTVDVAVMKCRAAGIKVMMLTGDQPSTAAAMAHKVNIITQPELEFNSILQNGLQGRMLSEEEALNQCNAIVIHGDTLAREMEAEQSREPHDESRGISVIMKWLRKSEVVFARVTPSQKLFIVELCQKMGHTVAVVGDGDNDAPAVRQANIGIATGSGSS